MLDAAVLALLAKVKMLAKKVGMNVDLVRMGAERAYAEQVLKELSNADDPELVLIAVQLMNQFGMIGVPTGNDGAEAKPNAARYVGSLR